MYLIGLNPILMRQININTNLLIEQCSNWEGREKKKFKYVIA